MKRRSASSKGGGRQKQSLPSSRSSENRRRNSPPPAPSPRKKTLAYLEQNLRIKRKTLSDEDEVTAAAAVKYAKASNKLAMELLAQGETEECERVLLETNQLLESFSPSPLLQPLLVLTLNNIGCMHRRTGRKKLALEYLLDAVQASADFPQVRNTALAYLNLCAVLSELGRHEEAYENAHDAVFHAQEELRTLERESEAKGKQTHDMGIKEVDKEEIETLRMETTTTLAIALYNLGVEAEYTQRAEGSLQWYQRAHNIVSQHREKMAELCNSIERAYEEAKQALSRVHLSPRSPKDRSRSSFEGSGHLSARRRDTQAKRDLEYGVEKKTPRGSRGSSFRGIKDEVRTETKAPSTALPGLGSYGLYAPPLRRESDLASSSERELMRRAERGSTPSLEILREQNLRRAGDEEQDVGEERKIIEEREGSVSVSHVRRLRELASKSTRGSEGSLKGKIAGAAALLLSAYEEEHKGKDLIEDEEEETWTERGKRDRDKERERDEEGDEESGAVDQAVARLLEAQEAAKLVLQRLSPSSKANQGREKRETRLEERRKKESLPNLPPKKDDGDDLYDFDHLAKGWTGLRRGEEKGGLSQEVQPKTAQSKVKEEEGSEEEEDGPTLSLFALNEKLSSMQEFIEGVCRRQEESLLTSSLSLSSETLSSETPVDGQGAEERGRRETSTTTKIDKEREDFVRKAGYTTEERKAPEDDVEQLPKREREEKGEDQLEKERERQEKVALKSERDPEKAVERGESLTSVEGQKEEPGPEKELRESMDGRTMGESKEDRPREGTSQPHSLKELPQTGRELRRRKPRDGEKANDSLTSESQDTEGRMPVHTPAPPPLSSALSSSSSSLPLADGSHAISVPLLGSRVPPSSSISPSSRSSSPLLGTKSLPPLSAASSSSLPLSPSTSLRTSRRTLLVQLHQLHASAAKVLQKAVRAWLKRERGRRRQKAAPSFLQASETSELHGGERVDATGEDRERETTQGERRDTLGNAREDVEIVETASSSCPFTLSAGKAGGSSLSHCKTAPTIEEENKENISLSLSGPHNAGNPSRAGGVEDRRSLEEEEKQGRVRDKEERATIKRDERHTLQSSREKEKSKREETEKNVEEHVQATEVKHEIERQEEKVLRGDAAPINGEAEQPDDPEEAQCLKGRDTDTTSACEETVQEESFPEMRDLSQGETAQGRAQGFEAQKDGEAPAGREVKRKGEAEVAGEEEQTRERTTTEADFIELRPEQSETLNEELREQSKDKEKECVRVDNAPAAVPEREETISTSSHKITRGWDKEEPKEHNPKQIEDSEGECSREHYQEVREREVDQPAHKERVQEIRDEKLEERESMPPPVSSSFPEVAGTSLAAPSSLSLERPSEETSTTTPFPSVRESLKEGETSSALPCSFSPEGTFLPAQPQLEVTEAAGRETGEEPTDGEKAKETRHGKHQDLSQVQQGAAPHLDNEASTLSLVAHPDIKETSSSLTISSLSPSCSSHGPALQPPVGSCLFLSPVLAPEIAEPTANISGVSQAPLKASSTSKDNAQNGKEETQRYTEYDGDDGEKEEVEQRNEEKGENMDEGGDTERRMDREVILTRTSEEQRLLEENEKECEAVSEKGRLSGDNGEETERESSTGLPDKQRSSQGEERGTEAHFQVRAEQEETKSDSFSPVSERDEQQGSEENLLEREREPSAQEEERELVKKTPSVERELERKETIIRNQQEGVLRPPAMSVALDEKEPEQAQSKEREDLIVHSKDADGQEAIEKERQADESRTVPSLHLPSPREEREEHATYEKERKREKEEGQFLSDDLLATAIRAFALSEETASARLLTFREEMGERTEEEEALENLLGTSRSSPLKEKGRENDAERNGRERSHETESSFLSENLSPAEKELDCRTNGTEDLPRSLLPLFTEQGRAQEIRKSVSETEKERREDKCLFSDPFSEEARLPLPTAVEQDNDRGKTPFSHDEKESDEEKNTKESQLDDQETVKERERTAPWGERSVPQEDNRQKGEDRVPESICLKNAIELAFPREARERDTPKGNDDRKKDTSQETSVRGIPREGMTLSVLLPSGTPALALIERIRMNGTFDVRFSEDQRIEKGVKKERLLLSSSETQQNPIAQTAAVSPSLSMPKESSTPAEPYEHTQVVEEGEKVEGEKDTTSLCPELPSSIRSTLSLSLKEGSTVAVLSQALESVEREWRRARILRIRMNGTFDVQYVGESEESERDGENGEGKKDIEKGVSKDRIQTGQIDIPEVERGEETSNGILASPTVTMEPVLSKETAEKREKAEGKPTRDHEEESPSSIPTLGSLSLSIAVAGLPYRDEEERPFLLSVLHKLPSLSLPQIVAELQSLSRPDLGILVDALHSMPWTEVFHTLTGEPLAGATIEGPQS